MIFSKFDFILFFVVVFVFVSVKKQIHALEREREKERGTRISLFFIIFATTNPFSKMQLECKFCCVKLEAKI